MEPKLMNCCKPEQVGTGNVKKRIQVLKDGRVLAKEAGNCKIEGQNSRITRKEYHIFLISLKMEGLMAHEDLWNLARESVLQDRGALPKEEGDVIREDMAMHEEIFLSSWLREDRKDKKENWMLTRKPKERRAKKDKRRGETRERDGDCKKVCQSCPG